MLQNSTNPQDSVGVTNIHTIPKLSAKLRIHTGELCYWNEKHTRFHFHKTIKSSEF